MDQIKGGGLHILIEIKADEVELFNSLTLSIILDSPGHHNQLFHPLGRLAAFLYSSNHESGACMTAILQWGHRVLGRGRGPSRV